MDLPREPRPSRLDLEIGRLLFRLETRLMAESVAAANECIEDLADALGEVADAGKPVVSPIARRVLKKFAE